MSTLVIETAFKASLVMAAAAAANVLLFRRASAAWRHLVWTLAVMCLLVLPIASAALPAWELPIHHAAPVATGALQDGMEFRDHMERRVFKPGVAAGSGDPALQKTVASTATLHVSTSSAGPRANLTSWLMIVSAVYVIGVLVLLARLVVDRWTVRRLARRATEVSDPAWVQLLLDCKDGLGVTRPVRLLRSLDRIMPMAFGTRRPAILIPSVADTWSTDRRRAVLFHEMAHIARHDCFTQLLAALSCALYWVHPGAWWIARRLRVERELACDDRVLAIGTGARDYAAHLLDLAYALGGSRAPALVVSMARPHQLEGRMLAVLDAARNRATPALGSRVASLVIASAFVIPLAAAEATFVPGTFVALRGASPQSDATAPSRAQQPRLPGTWEIRPSGTANLVHLRLNERLNSSHSFTIAIAQLEGLSPALLSGAGGSVQFSIRRDAGTFVFEGTFRSGVGAGTYTFTPSATFPAEMVKRGFARPTAADQYALAKADIGFAYLDELNAQKYTRPDLASLVRAGDHGVDLDYLRGMGQAGYRLGQVDALITERDHGVDPEFIHGLAAQGLTGLSAGDLLRARDHGVDPDYVAAMKALGYAPLSLDALLGARDHGIDPEYVRGLRQVGFQLTLAELTTARDHGVDPAYVRGMAGFGYDHLALGQLVGARDHGVDPEYVKNLRELGYQWSLADLTTARDHGVDPPYIRGLAGLGYEHLPLDQLVRLRDHGVDSKYAKEQNDRRHAHLPVDELIRLRDQGGGDSRSTFDRMLDSVSSLVGRWMK